MNGEPQTSHPNHVDSPFPTSPPPRHGFPKHNSPHKGSPEEGSPEVTSGGNRATHGGETSHGNHTQRSQTPEYVTCFVCLEEQIKSGPSIQGDGDHGFFDSVRHNIFENSDSQLSFSHGSLQHGGCPNNNPQQHKTGIPRACRFCQARAHKDCLESWVSRQPAEKMRECSMCGCANALPWKISHMEFIAPMGPPLNSGQSVSFQNIGGRSEEPASALDHRSQTSRNCKLLFVLLLGVGWILGFIVSLVVEINSDKGSPQRSSASAARSFFVFTGFLACFVWGVWLLLFAEPPSPPREHNEDHSVNRIVDNHPHLYVVPSTRSLVAVATNSGNRPAAVRPPPVEVNDSPDPNQ